MIKQIKANEISYNSSMYDLLYYGNLNILIKSLNKDKIHLEITDNLCVKSKLYDKAKFFNYHLKEIKDSSNFFVNKTNQRNPLYNRKNSLVKNIFLNAPNKSGKSHLVNIWIKNNNAILYKSNLQRNYRC